MNSEIPVGSEWLHDDGREGVVEWVTWEYVSLRFSFSGMNQSLAMHVERFLASPWKRLYQPSARDKPFPGSRTITERLMYQAGISSGWIWHVHNVGWTDLWPKDRDSIVRRCQRHLEITGPIL